MVITVTLTPVRQKQCHIWRQLQSLGGQMTRPSWAPICLLLKWR